MSDTAAVTPLTLLDLLGEELRCCRRMVTLANVQRDAMLAGDVETLAPAVREMEALAAVLARLEEERVAQAATLTPALGHPPADPPALPGGFGRASPARGSGAGGEGKTKAEQARVEELRGALRAALTELRALNDTNAALARRALASTEQALRLLHAALPATYEASGTLRPGRAGVGVRRSWTV